MEARHIEREAGRVRAQKGRPAIKELLHREARQRDREGQRQGWRTKIRDPLQLAEGEGEGEREARERHRERQEREGQRM